MESKVIVITGASRGLGAALARQLTVDGHRVVIAGRQKADLDAVAATCQGRATVVIADVSSRPDVERLKQEALAAYGQIDVWVNNAAVTSGKRVMDLDDAELDRVLAVNVKGPIYAAQVIVPHFLSRGAGHLINVGCFFGRVPLGPQRVAYNASKAALATLTADLRMDLQSFEKIKISLVMPGPLLTDAANKLPPYPGLTPQPAEEVADTIAGIIESPRAEVYSTPFLRALARRYHENAAEFEAGMATPLLRAPTTGNRPAIAPPGAPPATGAPPASGAPPDSGAPPASGAPPSGAPPTQG